MKTEIFKNDILSDSFSVTELDNGLKIYIMEKPEFNSVYAVYGTKYGSIDSSFILNGEKVDVPDGIAHFLEHKLFESEEGDAFTKFAKTGAYANAFTSFDRTCYIFSATSKFEENLDILLEFVQNPYFTAETVKKEQGIIGQEIKMYDDSPSWCVLFNMLTAMYHNNPVKIDIAGTVDSIAKIDDKVLYTCYNTFYNPANMFICIAGNINTTDVINRIKTAIKSHPKIDLKRAEIYEPESVVSGFVEKNLEVAMPLFCYGYKQDLKNRELTLRDNIAMNAFLKVLADDASPLYKRLTDLKLINDEFDAEYFCGESYAAVIFEGESSAPESVAEEINKEIENIRKNGINAELFEAVKRDMYGQAIKRYNSVEGIALMLVESAVLGYNYSDELNIIKNLTTEDLSKLLDIFQSDRAVLSVINKKV